MTYVITSACMGSKDASCVEVCPVDCIYEIDRMWLIHPGECIDCGACESECPVEAIYADVDVPETEQPYIAVDAAIAEGVAAAEAALDQLLADSDSGGDGGQQAA